MFSVSSNPPGGPHNQVPTPSFDVLALHNPPDHFPALTFAPHSAPATWASLQTCWAQSTSGPLHLLFPLTTNPFPDICMAP